MRNLSPDLPLRRRVLCRMRAHDSLPAPLRQWAGAAMLPYSAQSLRRIWDRHHRDGTDAALAALDRAQDRMLARLRQNDAG